MLLASFGKVWKVISLLYLESLVDNGTQQCEPAILNVCAISLAFNQTWQTHEKRESAKNKQNYKYKQ